MNSPNAPSSSVRYTGLSDRFRSLWTFYQFLNGVLKHLDEGPMPYTYNFQGLHRQMQDLIHKVGVDVNFGAVPELDQVERELDRIHRELARIEGGYPPSVMRKFFDHIKRQDEKVLSAILKFYLLFKHFEQDTLDKLDILFTRLAETPTDGERITARGPGDLLSAFQRLSGFIDLPDLPPAEETPLAEAVVAIRQELESIHDYPTLVDSQVYERYRSLKQRLGRTALHPSILVEITITNIVAKNRFKQLFEAEENKVVERANRITEIERYLERHPELANNELKGQLEDFRRFRVRYESGRRQENVKRDDITELTRAMHTVLAKFDASSNRPLEAAAVSVGSVQSPLPEPLSNGVPAGTADLFKEPELLDQKIDSAGRLEATSVTNLLPPDPLLNEALHKIMFALEMVVWDRLPAQVVDAPEIRNLKLEVWEIDNYRKLAEQTAEKGTSEWELQRFFLSTAALRVKMEEEREDINRLETEDQSERLYEVLEHSAQSLERARDTEGRFQWFIDDMLFRGETHTLEQIYRSRFRFLHAYSGLWLDHQRSGGLTPL